MLSGNRKIKIGGAIATLVMFALGVGCNGFFVNPTLTGITVGPTTSIQTGGTVQMTAVGTYNDGSTNTISSGVFWSSSATSIASVSTGGVVTGEAPGQATISGASGTVNGSATITVTLGGLTAIKVTSSDGTTSNTFGNSEQFVATGTANGQQYDITDSVNWTTNPTTITDVSIDSTGLLSSTSGPTSPVQFQVVATDPTTGISGYMVYTLDP